MEHAIVVGRNLAQGRRGGGFTRLAQRVVQHSKAAELSGALFAITVMAASGTQLARLDPVRIVASVPACGPFWLALASYYLITPLTDWIILRRLWALPLSGFRAVVLKLVGNELLFSYCGDAAFYAWARRNMPTLESPFAVVKDLALMSAFVGSVVTLAALVTVWPLLGATDWGGSRSSLVFGAALAVTSGGLVSVFARRLFSLSKRDMLFVASADIIRVTAQAAFAMLMWHFALPTVSGSAWLLLCAVRLVVTRLPLVPNKDVIFASVAVALVGRHDAIAPMMAMVAGLVMVTHVIVGTAMVAGRLSTKRNDRAAQPLLTSS